MLCEYLSDKTLRLHKKYADLQKEYKSQDEERIAYYKNKSASLDAERKNSQPFLTFANEVLYEVVPRLAAITGDKDKGVENISVDQGRRILELVEVELRSSKRNLKAVKDLNCELESQLN